MGRSLLLSDWLNRKDLATDDYLNQTANSDYKLTALGYGEPAFAAYYPNCYSVFCDIDPDLDLGASYEYQVIGWFNEAERRWTRARTPFHRRIPSTRPWRFR
jgi:hypothetical protein